MSISEPRQARLHRTTSETDITLSLSLDGHGTAQLTSGIGFFDHMLTALAKHGGLDLELDVKGDLHIDGHHTVEDVGIVLGQAFRQAVGDKRGIERFGHALVPLDEALCEAVIDISGRPYLAWNVTFPREKIGEMDTELFEEFFRAFAMSAHVALHLTCKAGTNAHHIAESAFKAFARAVRMAVSVDPRARNAIPSTKGVL
ncbi:imidazoleglycerol-phosphate dehydratase HisB [Gluconobacter wancherniae]|mgnify:CR=1 FL=1|uniref:Imidazoleglycerol-phosphate dehydratase n=1 Tax=Gluconobacter wancherniae NBRC 103581 TaxID=656744 RepID=A0A511AZ23_9PROT|nr:imidazoleglycerol-phosphate dehydratase HisB [Gluconobacter wancherniae]GBD56693.1 imidazoleglycerol-phosphate dehydratase [Gluconobacter wancherniae NBRC 103581]GBR64365.1 imidazoleglycerol-phosphate dehydratase [Gluconobacter wancherniae NBRC 103581]GEK92401.1 imidazoleglycerol-phosphate dehydratase [Gluconobacter wancherniae NBRC 103581]